MAFRFIRSLALLAMLALVASACAQNSASPSARSSGEEAPSELAFEDANETVVDSQLDKVFVAARGNISASPLWIADSEGLFEKHGIEVEFLPINGADDPIDRLLEFRADFAVDSSATALTRAANSLAPITAVSYIDGTSGGVAQRGTINLAARSIDAEEPWDGCTLIGKRIGVDSLRSIQSIAVKEMARNASCGDASVAEVTPDGETDPQATAGEEVTAALPFELVPMNALDMKVALQDGTIDAGIFVEPNITRLLRETNAEGSTLEPVSIVTNLDRELCGLQRCPTSFLVAANRFLESDPDVAQRFKAAVDEAISWIIANELDYRSTLVECCALTIADASGISEARFVGTSGDLLGESQSILDVLVAQGVITDRDRAESILRQAPASS